MFIYSISYGIKASIEYTQFLNYLERQDNLSESYKLYINFGAYGKKWSSAQITENYKIDELNGMQIIAAVNLGNKKIGKFTSEVLVMGVDDNNSNVLLLQPDKKIQNGAQVN